MMYSSLFFILLLHGCKAISPYFGNPYFRAVYGFPAPAFEAFGGNFPSFSNFPKFDSNWLSEIRSPVIGPSFHTFHPIVVPKINSIGENAECKEVADVDGLAFPPHSEIPTYDLPKEEILKNGFNTSTYLCNDNDEKKFYMLRTHAVFLTSDIRNVQDTARYYSMDKTPLKIGKDIKIDQIKLWNTIDNLQRKKEKEQEKAAELQKSIDSVHIRSFWSNFWEPFNTFNDPFAKADCEDHKFMPNLDYPKVDFPSVSENPIINKEVTYDTKFCVDKSVTPNKKFFSLKTTVSATTKNGEIQKQTSTLMHAADENGNPLPRADGATSVLASSYHTINNGVPDKSESSYATIHHA